jgi:hypothetical protein
LSTPITPKLEAALTALADDLSSREIALEWLHGGLLVDEVWVLLEDRHPQKVEETNRAFDEWKAERRRARKR